MTAIHGALTLTPDRQEAHRYESGNLLSIPMGTRMLARNLDPDALERIVVKAPPPAI